MITLGSSDDNGPVLFPFYPGDQFVRHGSDKMFFIISASKIDNNPEPTQIVTVMLDAAMIEAKATHISFRGWVRV